MRTEFREPSITDAPSDPNPSTYGDQTLFIHSSIRCSSIQAITCVVETAPDGLSTFFSGHFVFPLKIIKGGNNFPTAVQHKVAVIQLF